MKKLSLLLIAGSMALTAGAQGLVAGGAQPGRVNQKHEVVKIQKSAELRHNGHKTTSATGGWYDYVSYMDTLVTFGGAINSTSRSAPYLWNDTSSQDAYSGGVTDFNTLVSYAYIFDPTFSGFHTYFDLPDFSTPHAYTVDSLVVYGIYGINPAKTSVVDTLKIGYTYGSVKTTGDDILRSEFDASFAPGVLTNYGLASTDTLWFPLCEYDSASNLGMGTTYHEQVFTISNSAASATNINWGDTLSNGVMFHQFALTTPASVPAGDVLAVTVSFKSGDASFAFGDVVYGSTGAYAYNMFRPLIAYYSDASGNPVFSPYSASDNNCGLYKTLPNYKNGWGDVYVPMYAWTSGSGASTLQYPVMDLHLQCATCVGSSIATVDNINEVKAVPNPASNSTAISFKLDQTSNVVITLTDVTGQVVSTQNMNNVANGRAFINTANLAAGVYIYTITANGKHASGRVVVAH